MQERSVGSISRSLRLSSVSIAGLSRVINGSHRGLWRQVGFRGHDHSTTTVASFNFNLIPLTLTIDQASPSKLTNVSRCPIKVSWIATLTVRCPFATLNAL